MQENTLKIQITLTNLFLLLEVCILFKIGLCFKINKLSK